LEPKQIEGPDHDYSGLTFGRDRYGDNSGWWCWENYGNDNTSHLYGDLCLGDAKTVTGRSAKDTSPYPNGKLWAPNGIFLHGANARAYHWLGGGYTAPPTSESWIRGDIIINDAPKDGGCWGWVATTDGKTWNLGLSGPRQHNRDQSAVQALRFAAHFQFKNVPGSAALKTQCKFAPKMQETITHGARCTKLVRHLMLRRRS